MVFSPKFQEASDSLIIDNVLAVVARDMKAALDYYYDADDLPDFAERTLGQFGRLSWPSFAIGPNRNVTEENDGWISDDLRVDILIAVKDADAPTVTRTMTKYTRALRSVLRSASVDDYSANFPANSIFSVRPEISYDYGVIGKNGTEYEKIAHFDLLLKFNER